MNPPDKNFNLLRTRNWILAGITYGLYYLGRYNFSSSHAKIASEFNWKYDDYGIIISAALLIYGISVFLNGPLTDKIGGKKSLLIGTIGSAVFNLLFGIVGYLATSHYINFAGSLLSLVNWFTLIWVGNHYFQSFGALSIVKINSSWFQIFERGEQAGRFGVAIQIGRCLVLYLCPLILLFLPWYFTFWIPSILLFGMYFIIKKYIFDRPEDLGYQIFDTPSKENEEVKISLVLKKVFKTPVMWAIAAVSMCLGVTRNTIDHWFSRYFIDQFHLGKNRLIEFLPYKIFSISLPILLITAGFVAGKLSDKYFNARRGPIFAISFVGQLISLLILSYVISNAWLAAGFICLTLFFVQMGHTLLAGTASMDFGGRKAAATAAGFFDGASYLAGSIAGYLISKILQSYKGSGMEWSYWALFPILTVLIGGFISISLWNKKPGNTE